MNSKQIQRRSEAILVLIISCLACGLFMQRDHYESWVRDLENLVLQRNAEIRELEAQSAEALPFQSRIDL